MKNKILLLILIFCFCFFSNVYSQTNLINYKNFCDLIPNGRDFVIKVNIKKILSINEIQKILKEDLLKKDEFKDFYNELKNKAGLDLFNDIDNVIFFPNLDYTNKILGDAFLIEGNYNLEKIAEVIKEDSYKVKESNLIDITLKDGYYYGHAKEWNFFLINSRFIAIGSYNNFYNDIQSVIEKSKNTLSSNNKILKSFNEINSNSTICGVGFFSKEFKGEFANKPDTEFLTNIDSLFFDLDYKEKLDFNLKIKVDEEKNAVNILSKISNSTSLDPTIGKFVNSLYRDGEKISLSLTIPENVINEIKSNLTKNGKINNTGTVLKDLKKENKTYRVGEFIRVGYWSYQVYSSEWLDDRKVKSFNMFNGPSSYSYLGIRIEATNWAKNSSNLPPIKLVDSRGNEYDSANVFGGRGYLDKVLLFENVNPTLSVTGWVIFDVPQYETYRLKLSGGYWSNESVYVNLN